jgi:hypothetical protein
MREPFSHFLAAAVIGALIAASSSAALAKTAKECDVQFAANKDAVKAAKQAKKDYLAACRAGTVAAAPVAAPSPASGPEQGKAEVGPPDPKASGASTSLAPPGPDAGPTSLPRQIRHGLDPLDPLDPRTYGPLTTFTPPKAEAASTPLSRWLAKIGADSRTRGAGPSGPEAPSAGAQNLEDLNPVIAGLNDQQSEEVAGANDEALAPEGTLGAAPTSALAVALRHSLETCNDGAPKVGARPAGPDAPAVRCGRPRAFDASEGTRLDPLLNKTYDLNFAKAVPAMK